MGGCLVAWVVWAAWRIARDMSCVGACACVEAYVYVSRACVCIRMCECMRVHGCIRARARACMGVCVGARATRVHVHVRVPHVRVWMTFACWCVELRQGTTGYRTRSTKSPSACPTVAVLTLADESTVSAGFTAARRRSFASAARGEREANGLLPPGRLGGGVANPCQACARMNHSLVAQLGLRRACRVRICRLELLHWLAF